MHASVLLEIKAAYHHEHSKAGSTNLHENVGQAFKKGYVASDHRCDGDCWIEMAAGNVGCDVNCRQQTSGNFNRSTQHNPAQKL